VWSVAVALVLAIQLVAGVAVAAVGSRRVVTDVMTTSVVFLAFINVYFYTNTRSNSCFLHRNNDIEAYEKLKRVAAEKLTY